MEKVFSIMAGDILLFHSVAALEARRIHNWKAMTPILKAELDETGILDTEV